MSNFELENAYELRELDKRPRERNTKEDYAAVIALAIVIGLAAAIIIDYFFLT